MPELNKHIRERRRPQEDISTDNSENNEMFGLDNQIREHQENLDGNVENDEIKIRNLKKILDNIVTYRRVANILETSPAFKSHSHISKELRYFSDRLLDA
ncbi:2533_t:CDS:2, partial [Funneliformis caledonium]